MLVGGLVLVGLLGDNSRIPNGLGSEQMPKTSNEVILIDKVYTFLAPLDSITCEGQFLKAQYNYWVRMEIVTPHDCLINVTIIDPEQEVYDVYGKEYNATQDELLTFPFGTAIAGNYTFIFSVEAELNLNMLLKVTYDNSENGKCLYDGLSPFDRANLKYYNVTKFHDQEVMEDDQIFLRTDYCYKFYIGRVTSIAKNLPHMHGVGADYDIDDPSGIPFKIYFNESLSGVYSVSIFRFGTAVEGLYTVKIVIHCRVDVVNVAYAIVESHRISTEDECNCTDPDPIDLDPEEPEPNNGTNNNETNPQNYYYVPIEWTLGFAVVAGGAVSALIVMGCVHKKKNR